MKILMIRDHRPGHYNQSEGVAAAIGRLGPVEVIRHQLKLPRWIPTRIIRAIVGIPLLASSLPLSLLRYLTGLSDLHRDLNISIVLSTGGKTLASNIVAARVYDAANILCGSPRNFSDQAFRVVIHSDNRYEGRSNYILGLKPSPIEPKERSYPSNRLQPTQRAVLLVGGPISTHAYSQKDISALCAMLLQTTMHWTVFNSPRTPDSWSDKLAECMKKNTAGTTFRDCRHDGLGGIAQALADADFAVVTDDSASMISEAIAANIPVVSLAVDNTKDGVDTNYLELLRQKLWLQTIFMGEVSERNVQEAAALCQPMRDHHLDTLAAALSKHLPELKQN